MLIVKITRRLWLAFPDNGARQYVFCEELSGKSLAEGESIVEAIVEDRYQEWLKRRASAGVRSMAPVASSASSSVATAGRS